MRAVQINGVSHAIPFADILRPLTDAEYRRLRESVINHGIRYPVVTFTSDDWGPSIVDGANRADLAIELELRSRVPVIDLGRISEQVARDLAYSLNLDRRHITPAEMVLAAEARRGRAASRRADGDSLRTIAATEGVSLVQVQRDLAAAGVPGGTPETASRVHGQDGKVYPATAGDTPERQLERTRRSLDRVIGGAVELADGSYSSRLQQLARMHGVPLTIAGGSCVWPALTSVRAVLADLAAAVVGGGE